MENEDLVIKQNELQKEGNEVLEKIGLLSTLSNYGQVVVSGSLVTGLMSWRDIDIEVLTENPSIDSVFNVAKLLLENNKVKSIQVQDNTRHRMHDHQPDGMYLGFRYQGQDVWKFDIWFLTGNNHTGKDDIEWINSTMTPEKQKSILNIKSKISDNPKYRKSIFSIDIYKAVLNENVKSYDEFGEYLKRTNRNI